MQGNGPRRGLEALLDAGHLPDLGALCTAEVNFERPAQMNH